MSMQRVGSREMAEQLCFSVGLENSQGSPLNAGKLPIFPPLATRQPDSDVLLCGLFGVAGMSHARDGSQPRAGGDKDERLMTISAEFPSQVTLLEHF